MKKILTIICFLSLLMGCSGSNLKTEKIDGGCITDTLEMSTSFNEAQRMMIKTDKYNFIVYGYHTVRIGAKTIVRKIGDKYDSLCVDGSESCFLIDN